MADNGTGTYVLDFVWATDKANAVAVTASRMDTQDSGIATALTNRICKDGQTTTTARIPFTLGIGLGTGTVALPAINFTSDTNTGVYSIGADNIGIVCGGAKVLDIATTGLGVTGTFSVSTTTTLTGNVTLGAALSVTGLTTINGTLAATGALTVGGNAGVTGTMTCSSTLTVTGAGQFNSTLGAGNTTITGTLGVSSTSTFSAGVTCSTTLAVAGAASLNSTSSHAGTATFNGAIACLGSTTTASAANAFIDHAGGDLLLRSTSSSKYKSRIRNINPQEAIRIVYGARPVAYHSLAKADDPEREHLGLIAEELAEVDPRLINFDAEGKPDGVQYERSVVALLSVVSTLAQRAGL